MFKQVVIIAIVCIGITLAGSVPESSEVKEQMHNAFKQGLEKFGGSVTSHQNRPDSTSNIGEQSKKVFSQYTKDLTSLGGGRPLLREMNRVHHYVPLAPSVLPKEFHIAGDKMTPAEAAKILVPGRPLQYTEDHQH